MPKTPSGKSTPPMLKSIQTTLSGLTSPLGKPEPVKNKFGSPSLAKGTSPASKAAPGFPNLTPEKEKKRLKSIHGQNPPKNNLTVKESSKSPLPRG